MNDQGGPWPLKLLFLAALALALAAAIWPSHVNPDTRGVRVFGLAALVLGVCLWLLEWGRRELAAVSPEPEPAPRARPPADPVAAVATTVGRRPLPSLPRDSGAVLEGAREWLLGHYGVVDVELGYHLDAAGRLTDEQALLVASTDPARSRGLLPERIDGVPIDVVPASVEQQRAMLAGGAPATLAVTPATVRIGYQQKPGLSLDLVEDEMTVVCHVGPDHGWPTLSDFLAATTKRLDVVVYNFGAAYILDEVERKLGEPDVSLALLLDEDGAEVRPAAPAAAATAGARVSEDEVVKRLSSAAPDRFQFTWDAAFEAGGLFRNSHHTKVAVRDERAFWLSSGNWTSSSQPKVDLTAPGESLRPLLSSNREWHVIVEHLGLAKTFRDVLRWDFTEAQRVLRGGARPAAPAMPDLLVAEPAAARPLRPGTRAFSPREFRKRIRIQPVLTPDNYAKHVLPMINGAQRSISFQNQYINVGAFPAGDFKLLLEALAAKSQEPSIDVKIIVGSRDAQQKLSRMKAFGFDMSQVRVQDNCHNKGIVVDGQLVLVGSHNWSGDGTTYNRDASLLFDDAEIAGYYEEVFLHDWAVLATDQIAPAATPAVAALPGVPPGMRRVGWHELLDD